MSDKEKILVDAKERMQKTLHSLSEDLLTIRAGKANPAILNKIVDKINKQVYYDACLESKICPVCGGELNTYENHSLLRTNAYKCRKCKFVHGIDENKKYIAIDGKVYDKKCYTCVVEWLDDQCSTEQDKCDSCIIDGVYTKWERYSIQRN